MAANTGAASYSHGAAQCGDYFLIISQNAYYRIIITGKKRLKTQCMGKKLELIMMPDEKSGELLS